MRTEKSNSKNNITKRWKGVKYSYWNNKSNSSTSWKIHPIFKHLLVLFVIAIVFWAFYAQSSNFKWNNWSLVGQKIVKLFQFKNQSDYVTGSFSGEYTNLWVDSFKALWINIQNALTGTFIGFLLAVLTAYLSFSKGLNKYIAVIFKFLLLFLRAIPELVFILVISGTFRFEFSLLLVYSWFTWLWLHKYYIDILENTEIRPFYVSLNQGNSPFKAFLKEIFPRVKHRFNALFIFSFESNIRWSSILGTLGLPGIGALIKYGSSSTSLFAQLGIPLLVLVIFVAILEIANIFFKKYLFEAKSREIKVKHKFSFANYEQLSKIVNIRKIILSCIYLIFVGITIYTLATTRYLTVNAHNTVQFIKYLFNPDFSGFSIFSNLTANNPILIFWESFQFSTASFAICIILTLISIRLQSIKINKTYFAFSFRMLNVLIRILPTIVFIYLFLPLFTSAITIIFIVVGIHEMSSMSKQITEAIDSLDEEIIANMRLQGYSNNAIYFKYVLPSIKFDLISMSTFYFELIFRASITYSIFSENKLTIGTQITINMDTRNFHPEKAMTYVWIGTISILFINLSSYLLLKKIKK
ncbi:ABC transporter permease [Mycoplasmopsis californica HAZ160_1]|uniref:ABC transporter permease n=1 Tax=Mycoplasmopsis californica HAZ160_1 TaxID=1397850 RepID=A0AAT9F8G1_9BACT|nr:ABC transporter permease subunit [Mycoplasmopsis californica]BAP01149.1 ABC transporter permease [Mycoplasmopsis californica HAZ160_1]BBG41015.1 ABC transporter permease [Mycoplasmopsis californica]BBG41608.1 ABC transporter permease [Mycoplasmopsis californica]BBG42202.1 ABC transporter permease [Mycoplasmopsis californica]BBG42784.1 ABC transporter permease [Mycoplasmopsis californica]